MEGGGEYQSFTTAIQKKKIKIIVNGSNLF
jgi:hypothetical protein